MRNFLCQYSPLFLTTCLALALGFLVAVEVPSFDEFRQVILVFLLLFLLILFLVTFVGVRGVGRGVWL